MKQTKRLIAVVLALLMVASLAACGAAPEKKILGAWRDSNGALGYDFHEDDSVTIHFVNFKIPIVNYTVDQDITGSYTVYRTDDKVNHLTITYKVLVEINDEFTFEIDKDILRLTNTKSGDTYTLTRAVDAPEATTTTMAAPDSTAQG